MIDINSNSASMRFLFAFFRHFERYGDLSPVESRAMIPYAIKPRFDHYFAFLYIARVTDNPKVFTIRPGLVRRSGGNGDEAGQSSKEFREKDE